MSEGTASAQRILGMPMNRVDASQLKAPVYVSNGRIEELPESEMHPLRKTAAIVGMALAAWGVTGVVVFAAYKLVEVMR